jgi:hypothetical protein
MISGSRITRTSKVSSKPMRVAHLLLLTTFVSNSRVTYHKLRYGTWNKELWRIDEPKEEDVTKHRGNSLLKSDTNCALHVSLGWSNQEELVQTCSTNENVIKLIFLYKFRYDHIVVDVRYASTVPLSISANTTSPLPFTRVDLSYDTPAAAFMLR